MASGGAIVGGALLLLIGGFIFMVGYNASQQYSTSLGQLARTFSPELEQKYQYSVSLQILGGIMSLIGLIATIAGASSGPSSSPTTVHVVQPQTGTFAPTRRETSIPTREELLRGVIKALDQGDTELSRKLMDQIRSLYCSYCGAYLVDGSKFCMKCGKCRV